MTKRKRNKTEAARRAFRAKESAEKLGISPKMWQQLEKETDRQHAYFSSLVSGTKLSGTDFRKVVKSEETET